MNNLFACTCLLIQLLLSSLILQVDLSPLFLPHQLPMPNREAVSPQF